jgi:hypothetical protein
MPFRLHIRLIARIPSRRGDLHNHPRIVSGLKEEPWKKRTNLDIRRPYRRALCPRRTAKRQLCRVVGPPKGQFGEHMGDTAEALGVFLAESFAGVEPERANQSA